MEEKKKPVSEGTPGKDGIPIEHRQRTPFPRTRAGIVLTREKVKAIKEGRKKLRKELRERGIKSKKEFELTASSLMLYFDKHRRFGLLLWLFHGRGLWALLGAALALVAALFAMSMISQMQGHFTINMTGGMFREGFSLSETKGFENPTMRLFAQPAEDVPCSSIRDIHDDVNDVDGQHDEVQYFAYTYYIRNEGDNTVDYTWQMQMNSESQNLSSAVWVMIFEDDAMKFYAQPREDGTQEALPAFGDNTRGYLEKPFFDYAALPTEQYELITSTANRAYYRLIPVSFESDEIIASGFVEEVEPMEVHKYTVVIWLEGDDPDCTNDLIGGHAGVEMNFRLAEEEVEEESGWEKFWNNLIFWDDE